MVQESIVDYINSQMKLGVSRDAIKTTLTGAGWVATDVEDTLKKVELAKTAQPISAMSAFAKPAEPVIASKLITPAGSATSPEPQTIKVSDLISASAPVSVTPAASAKPIANPTSSKSPLTGPVATATSTPAGIKSANTFQAASYSGIKTHGSRGALITEIILAIIIIVVGVFAGFLYMQNSGLNSKLNSLNGQSSSVTSQLSALQAQMAASTTALTAQVSSLNTETQELKTELSFYAAPSSTVQGATSTATVSGVVSGGGRTPYIISATYGAKIYVANSKVAGVIAALAPLMGTASTTATTAQFSGTYAPGSDSMTLTAVNGTALQ